MPLRETRKRTSHTFARLPTRPSSDCLVIDDHAQHLEVVAGSEGGTKGSLLDEIDRTVTSMGGGCSAPGRRACCRSSAIRGRLDAVEELAFRSTERASSPRRSSRCTTSSGWLPARPRDRGTA